MPEAIKPEEQRLLGIPFDFEIGTTAGASYVEKYTISAGYNFIWEMLQASKRNTSGVPDSVLSPSIREVYLNIRDEFTGKDMFTSGICLLSVTGYGFSPFILPRPYIFRGGTTITVTIEDTHGGSEGFYLQIVLFGRLVPAK
ncbi:MAG TPA: hypothetical protein ENG63_05730 [Candidatus Desulfofervidus auxilii]|uniref:Uncharacterized protein n=1 Tax=Desulfofervidus auxilii TaxID=1621989 RepID=A0A7C0Y4S4_DESA2|nr:hypothetical protein [Candidatus Desulfofervidus auxilii]